MDKLKYVRIREGISSNDIPIGADASNIDLSNGKDLQSTLGDYDYTTKGNIKNRIDNLDTTTNNLTAVVNTKANQTDLNNLTTVVNTKANQAALSDLTVEVSTKASKNQVAALKSLVGSPLIATSTAQMTDTSKIYVYTGNQSGYINGNWYYYNGDMWISGGVYNAVAVATDATLSIPGDAADAAAVGEELADLKSHLNDLEDDLSDEVLARTNVDNHLDLFKVNMPLDEYNQPSDGTQGQSLRTNGDGTTEWADVGLPTDEQTAEAINAWLAAHPEATTTVEDGSLTIDKFSESLKKSIYYEKGGKLKRQLYGRYDNACLVNASPDGRDAGVMGITGRESLSNYKERDRVSIFSSAYGDLETNTHILTALSFTSASVELNNLSRITVEPGMFVDVFDSSLTENTKYSGIVNRVEGNVVYVDWWVKVGDSSVNQIPDISTYYNVLINPCNAVWVANFSTSLDSLHHNTISVIQENDIYNTKPNGVSYGIKTITKGSHDSENAYYSGSQEGGSQFKRAFEDRNSKESFYSEDASSIGFHAKTTRASLGQNSKAFVATRPDGENVFSVLGNGYVERLIYNYQRITSDAVLDITKPHVIILDDTAEITLPTPTINYSVFYVTAGFTNYSGTLTFKHTTAIKYTLANGDRTAGTTAIVPVKAYSPIKLLWLDTAWVVITSKP